jgi:hypothetical protein
VKRLLPTGYDSIKKLIAGISANTGLKSANGPPRMRQTRRFGRFFALPLLRPPALRCYAVAAEASVLVAGCWFLVSGLFLTKN